MSEQTKRSPAPGAMARDGGKNRAAALPQSIEDYLDARTQTPIPISTIRAYEAGFGSGQITGDTLGHLRGFTEGYRRAVTEMKDVLSERIDAQYRDHWTAVNRAVVESVVKRGPYADMAEKRGHSDRAARQRQILTEKGIG